MAGVAAALGVGIEGPIKLWLLSLLGLAGEVTLDLLKGMGGAVSALIGGDAEMCWMPLPAPLAQCSGAEPLRIGLAAHRPWSLALQPERLRRFGIWLLAVTAIELFPNSHTILFRLLMDTSQTEFGLACSL